MADNFNVAFFGEKFVIYELTSSSKENCTTFITGKAELLQLKRTQFPSLGIFVSKKSWKSKKLRPLLFISVLKVVY